MPIDPDELNRKNKGNGQDKPNSGKDEFVGSSFAVQFTPGDKANSVVFDNTKLKKAVPGFAPSIRFEEGVRRCLEYILAHPECQVEDPEFDEWSDNIIEALDKTADSWDK